METIHYALVLGASYRRVCGREDGRLLDMVALERVRRARQYVRETGAVPVVMAVPCPRFLDQKETYGELLANRLSAYGVVMVPATVSCDTWGELTAFVSYVNAVAATGVRVQVSVITHAVQFWRLHRLLRLLVSDEVLDDWRFVAADLDDEPLLEEWLVERIKYVYHFVPSTWKQRWRRLARCFVR